jgi:hypothetical protein
MNIETDTRIKQIEIKNAQNDQDNRDRNWLDKQTEKNEAWGSRKTIDKSNIKSLALLTSMLAEQEKRMTEINKYLDDPNGKEKIKKLLQEDEINRKLMRVLMASMAKEKDSQEKPKTEENKKENKNESKKEDSLFDALMNNGFSATSINLNPDSRKINGEDIQNSKDLGPKKSDNVEPDPTGKSIQFY